MAAFARQEILDRLRAKVEAGEPILGGGAGTGISAKLEEAGGIDLIVIYNSGRFRMAGRGSLAGLMPYGDANAIVMEMAGEVLPAAQNTPVLAGVCGTDPFRLMPVFLKQVQAAGLTPPTFKELSESLGQSRDGLSALLALCAEEGLVVAVSDDLHFAPAAIEQGRVVCQAVFAEESEVTMSQLREAWGISRKFAVPLCEYYDEVEITVRQGDVRVPGPRLAEAVG